MLFGALRDKSGKESNKKPCSVHYSKYEKNGNTVACKLPTVNDANTTSYKQEQKLITSMGSQVASAADSQEHGVGH